MNVAAAEISVDEVERQAVAPQIFEDFIDELVLYFVIESIDEESLELQAKRVQDLRKARQSVFYHKRAVEDPDAHRAHKEKKRLALKDRRSAVRLPNRREFVVDEADKLFGPVLHYFPNESSELEESYEGADECCDRGSECFEKDDGFEITDDDIQGEDEDSDDEIESLSAVTRFEYIFKAQEGCYILNRSRAPKGPDPSNKVDLILKDFACDLVDYSVVQELMKMKPEEILSTYKYIIRLYRDGIDALLYYGLLSFCKKKKKFIVDYSDGDWQYMELNEVIDSLVRNDREPPSKVCKKCFEESQRDRKLRLKVC